MSVTMSAVYDQTCHVCEKIKKYLLHYHYNSQRNRQLSANREIYRVHMRMDRDKDYHLHRMNENVNREYDLKIKQLWDKPIEYDGL